MRNKARTPSELAKNASEQITNAVSECVINTLRKAYDKKFES